jgi:hypothetical protein
MRTTLGLAFLIVWPLVATGQVVDSSVSPALTWIDYFNEARWDSIVAGGKAVGPSEDLLITSPRVAEGVVVVYGRATVHRVTDYVTGWSRRNGNHIWLHLTRARYHNLLSWGERVQRIFGARIGPLPPGRYTLQVVWTSQGGEETLIEEPVLIR